MNILSRISGFGEPYQLGKNATLASIQGALSTAEQGDTYQLFTLYRDMILNSSHIQQEMGKRVMSTTGNTVSIQPYMDGSADDKVAAEVIQDMIANCPNYIQGSMHLMGGHLWPVAVAEKIYEPVSAGDDTYVWRHPVRYRLKELHPVNYALLCYRVSYFNAQNGGGYLPSRATPPGIFSLNGGSPLTYENAEDTLNWNPDDWEPDLRFYSTYTNGMINFDLAATYKAEHQRHVVHRGNITTGYRDNYGGALRGVLFWWFLSTVGRDWFSRFMERYGSPFSVAYVNAAQKDVVDLVTKAFSSATKVGALILPKEAKVELKEIMVSGAADGYIKYLGLCDDQITKAILGQTLSTTAKGTGMGSGVADLQGEVRDEWRQYDERVFGATEEQQIFTPFLRLNGYKGRVKVIRGGLTKGNALLQAQTLKTLKDAGIKPSEESFPVLSQRFGFRVEAIPANEINNNQNGQPKPKSEGNSK